jgi:hypothetical protein
MRELAILAGVAGIAYLLTRNGTTIPGMGSAGFDPSGAYLADQINNQAYAAAPPQTAKQKRQQRVGTAFTVISGLASGIAAGFQAQSGSVGGGV